MAYPLVFTIKDAVHGCGFMAGVKITHGRALADYEDGAWWIFGVKPAPIAETAPDAILAFRAFRDTYRKVLFDIAEESADYAAFQRGVEEFFAQSDPADEQRWTAARDLIRAGQLQPVPPFSDLPKEVGDVPSPRIEVVLLDSRNSDPAKNEIDRVATYAANKAA